MATTSTTVDPHHSAQHPHKTQAALLVSLPSLTQDAARDLLTHLAEAFAAKSVMVATPDADVALLETPSLRVVAYTPAVPSPGSWSLTATDFLTVHELAQQHQASSMLLLGPEAQSLTAQALHGLAEAVQGTAGSNGCDLATARYSLQARSGLVNSAILYPLSRALFGAAARFPLAIDLGLSTRLAARLAAAAQRFTAANQHEALLWPVSEAAVAGFTITQVEAGVRLLPQPTVHDLNGILAHVTGSFFSDIDAKAAFWQRSRVAQPARLADPLAVSGMHTRDEVQPMLEAFRNAYGNLSEIWSLVLPPQSLLGLKRLAVLSADTFILPDSLWARIVYDFLLAYRLRTINRGHLLGALTPLYLAWVASHILQTSSGRDPEQHIEALAAAFETDKPYLVSRWRWPDRFNP